MKYSFKNDTTKSSVVVLRDGRAMEVRRGEKTSFAAGERQTWPSLDEWMATLPDGASVKVSKSKPAAKPRLVITNPVLARFLERARAGPYGGSIPRQNMRYVGTRAEIICAEKARERKEYSEGWKTWVSPAAHERMLEILDSRLAAQVESGTAEKPVYRAVCGHGAYITMTAGGEIHTVRYNQAHNAIGYFLSDDGIGGDWGVRFLSTDFVELTDPEMPVWRLMQGGPPVKIR